MRGNVLVRCGGRWTETYCRNAARRCPSTPLLILGFGPGFGLFAGDKGRAIEHVAIVIGRLSIPGLGLGRLAGVGVHLLRVLALEDAPWPSLLILGFGPGFGLFAGDKGRAIE